MQCTTSDDIVMDYNVYGNGDTTLLFVHGSCIDQTYWAGQVSYFQEKYKVVTVDLPGHGKSGHNREQYSLQTWGSDIVWLIKMLLLDNVVLVGHSMGGSIIMHAAVAYPDIVKGFVGVDYFKSVGHPLPPEYLQQSQQIIKGLETDFEKTNTDYAKMVLITPATPPAIAERVLYDYKNADPKTVRDVMPEIFGTLYKDEQVLLPQIPVKLHTINVDYMLTNEALLKEYCKNDYEVIHIQGTCHYPMIEQPMLFNEKLEKILTEIQGL